MDFECPLCNSLIDIKELCPRCGQIMEDRGRVEDYFDPYNPYLDKSIVTMGQPSHQCVHLFYCPQCDRDTRIIVNQIPV